MNNSKPSSAPENPVAISAQQHATLLRFASGASVIVAIILISAKAWAWLESGSVSIMASLIDSSMDAIASIINLLAIRYALMPADDDHRFGHGKAEALAGIAQSMFIVGSASFLLLHAVGRAHNPEELGDLDVGLWVMILSLLLTSGLVLLQKYTIAKTQSTAIEADSLHYIGDILMNLAVIAALYMASRGITGIDTWLGVAIALFLVYSAWKIGEKSFHYLLDREIGPEVSHTIETLISQQEKIKGFHDLRTRESGIQQFIQLHIELDAHMSLIEAHDIAEALEMNIIAEFPRADVIIHQDPVE